jgi:hypothetical protein
MGDVAMDDRRRLARLIDELIATSSRASALRSYRPALPPSVVERHAQRLERIASVLRDEGTPLPARRVDQIRTLIASAPAASPASSDFAAAVEDAVRSVAPPQGESPNKTTRAKSL